MNVKEMAEEFLVCPKCRGHLEYMLIQEDGKEEKEILLCRTCDEYYTVEDDIPILLIDEAKKMNR